MSKNFFAALDDSGDEGVAAPQVSKKQAKKKPPAPPQSSAAAPSEPDRRRQPNNENRRTKAGRGGRPPAREGKRTYDRHSGTGRGKEIKKGGGGGRNWGSDKNDARELEGPVMEGHEGDALEEQNPQSEREEAKEAEEANKQPEEEPLKEEEEDKTMSYEEFMKSKQTPDSTLFAPKEVKEVENEFAGVSLKVKTEEDFLVMGAGKMKRKKGTKKEEKKTIVAGFKVADSNAGSARRYRDRGDGDRRGSDRRGGRGGGHGRGGDRSGGRGSDRSKKSPEVDVADTNAFPSL